MRFTEYVTRFVRLASKYEEEITGITRIGYLTSNFVEGTMERHAQLGSGISFGDEASCIRELNANAHRIHAWRSTNSYRHCVTVRRWAYHRTRLIELDQDFARQQASGSIKSIDVLHQVLRLKNSKNISDSEVYLILRTLADNTKTYEQVIEVTRLPNRSPHNLTSSTASFLPRAIWWKPDSFRILSPPSTRVGSRSNHSIVQSTSGISCTASQPGPLDFY